MPEETFPVGDVEELSKRLSIFLKNPSSLNSPEILKEKKRRIETEFNWDVIAKQTADLYHRVIQMPARR